MPLYVNTYSHRNGMEALYLLLVLAIWQSVECVEQSKLLQMASGNNSLGNKRQ